MSQKPRSILSSISSDEEVVFYPTCGSYDEEQRTWKLPIHGIIYEPEDDSQKRDALVKLIRKSIGLEAGEAKSQFLDQRLRLFLVDNERDQEISVQIGDRVYSAGTSEADGHFHTTITLTADEAEKLVEAGAVANRLTFEAVTRPWDERRITGCVQLIRPEGLSIISDVDDTIKHSAVGDTKALLANTFLRKFKPVAGMPELYRQCAELGFVFHYVSGSPWQLYTPLAEFVEEEQFPAGSFSLKHFRLKDRSMVDLLRSQETHKLRAIEPILRTYPGRRFILIGDSGEEDPEIYAKVAKKHGKQVVAIFIRNVTDEAADNPRFKSLREGLGDVPFELFENPDSLLSIIREIDRE